VRWGGICVDLRSQAGKAVSLIMNNSTGLFIKEFRFHPAEFGNGKNKCSNAREITMATAFKLKNKKGLRV
jgi:hypothetical protein